MSSKSTFTAESRSQRMRLDRSHLITREQLMPPNPPAEHELNAIAGCDPAQLVDQLQRQAHELGQRLQCQHMELSKREAEFHARLARIENETRTSRLMGAEREFAGMDSNGSMAAAPADRSEFLKPHLIEEAYRVAEEGRFEPIFLDPVSQGHAPAITNLPDSKAAPPKRAADPPNRHNTITRTDAPASTQEWKNRIVELDKSERLLQSQLAQVAFDRKKLDAERTRFVEMRQRHSHLSNERVNKAKIKFESELLKLQEFSQKLDKRQLAVQQLHAQASRMHRDALESRLCTEQLWAELNESAPSDEVTKRMSELRCRLADQFHLAEQKLADKHGELTELVRRLESHQKTLRTQRDELRHWIARRHAEIESDTTKLLARERDLDRKELALSQLKTEWTEQRHEYEQRIRRLNRLVHPTQAV